MKFLSAVLTLHVVCAVSAHRYQVGGEEETPVGMPQEKLFEHPKGIPLTHGSKHDQKFAEDKLFPVEYFSPPNRIIEELYYKKNAELDQYQLLLEKRAFTDTDLIMMNRWRGIEQREDLWEADMLLTKEQRHLYKKQGRVYEDKAKLIPDFSTPWPNGNISYFHENEGSVELFDRLRQAMDIWQSALGCVNFSVPKSLANFSSLPTMPPTSTTEEAYYYDTDPLRRSTRAAGAGGPLASGEAPDEATRRLQETADHLRVTVSDGCYATVGFQPWSRLVIGEHCSLGVLVHLLGHVLGLPHEHSRPDRHLNINLHPENVQTRDFMFLNFQSGGRKCSNDSTAGWYDLRSVMHLDPFGLSVSNSSSMSAQHFAQTAHMGATWTRPSYNDVLRLRQPAAYGCREPVPARCRPLQRFCPGQVRRSDCQCVRAAGCLADEEGVRGACSGLLHVGAPHAGSDTGAEQLRPPAAHRGRSCAWTLRTQSPCQRIRLTLSVRMEEEARVAAAALGCGPLLVETHDNDTQDAGHALRNALCLSDFAHWPPAQQGAGGVDGGSWLAHRVVVSTSPELRLLIRSYPTARNTPLARVLGSLSARAETAVDRACHCNLDLY